MKITVWLSVVNDYLLSSHHTFRINLSGSVKPEKSDKNVGNSSRSKQTNTKEFLQMKRL